MSFHSLLTNTGRNSMSTLVEEVYGETHTVTETGQRLYTELLALAKQYPVIVNISGAKLKAKRLQSINLDHFLVSDLVAPVPREHVTVTLSKKRLDGHGQFVFDMLGIDKSKIIS